MTKKDYQAIAECFKDRADAYNIALRLCVVLKKDNPRFDEERFLYACFEE